MLFLVFVGIFYVAASADTVITPADFDSQSWQAAMELACVGDDNTRLSMVRDLEAILPHISNDTLVLATLGEPDTITRSEQGDTWAYCLGYNIIDFDSYLLMFDAYGNLIDWTYSQG